jgi:hypothetical protein
MSNDDLAGERFTPDSPEIETLMLANHAEAINNLLYVQGGGWTDHWRQVADGKALASQVSLGLALLVPWTATNVPYQISIWFETGDGRPLEQRVQATLNMGRPPGLPPGAQQRASMAINVPNITFPEDGDYCVKAEIGNSKPKVVNFRVHTLALPFGAPAAPPLG